MPPTSGQYITFTPFDPPGGGVTCLLGDGFPRLSNKGGWQFTPRRHTLSITEYVGDDPLQLVVPCILDRFAEGAVVDHDFNALRGMMVNLVGPRSEPAVVYVTGPASPLPMFPWVIQTIDTTDEVRLEWGPCTRKEFTVTLWQYIAPTIMGTSVPTSPAKAAVVRNAAPTVTRTYVVRSGDTLWDIAARLLGNAARWSEIATLNGVRDPRTLQIGQVLRLP